MLKTIQIAAMLQISKRQSPATAPFWCSIKSKYFCYRLHRDWCNIISRSTIDIVLSYSLIGCLFKTMETKLRR